MFSEPAVTSTPSVRPVARVLPAATDRAGRQAPYGGTAQHEECRQIDESLRLLQAELAPQRRIVHAGDVLYEAGAVFDSLHIVNTGFCKLINVTADGREQVVGLKFRGDWLGFDGIANGRHGCDAVAMDTGEVWVVRYDSLIAAAVRCPQLLNLLHEAMSRQIGRDRESLMAVCTLPADARVADFLHYWAHSLAVRGMRTDQITLRMTRAEIGNYLGMTLETVSRALSRMARANVIEFVEKGRRDIRIADVDALSEFVQACLAPRPVAATLQ